MTSRTAFVLVTALGLPALAVNCGGGGNGNAPPVTSGDGGLEGTGGGSNTDGGFPPAAPADPCATAGYYFVGESDCNVVRCPELRCECPAATPDPGAAPKAPEVVTLHACVPGQGCLDLADCTRICNPTLRLTQTACQERLAKSGAETCTADTDCITGHCREESVGKICVDVLPCAEDGHCSSGFLCRFDPGSLEAVTKRPTTLGLCSDGSYDSACYQDSDCRVGSCSGNRCTGGREGDSCALDADCTSGFCRLSSTAGTSGTCVSGAAGGSCLDDSDCTTGLHCSSGVCYASEVGQICDSDGDCASHICVSSICRGGEPGSACEADTDCKAGVCAGGACTSGELFSPCYEPADCRAGFKCAEQVCTDGSVGSPCSAVTDCITLACVRSSCTAGDNGDPCDNPTDCKSGRCADPAGVEVGECTSGAKGSRCLYGSNCVSGSCAVNETCN